MNRGNLIISVALFSGIAAWGKTELPSDEHEKILVDSEQVLAYRLEKIQRLYFPVCLPSLSERLIQPAGSFPLDFSRFSPKARKQFDKVVEGTRSLGVRYSIRFHLHPDLRVALDPRGDHATLRGPDAIWTLSQDGGRLTIEDSVYFDEARPNPRATKQLVVTARAKEYWGRVTWALRRVDKPGVKLRTV